MLFAYTQLQYLYFQCANILYNEPEGNQSDVMPYFLSTFFFVLKQINNFLYCLVLKMLL